MLLLRDLIRDLDIQLVAGEAGLDRPVRWVHISELDDPTPWLSGGELLLTTGMNLAEPETQRAFVERLAGHDLAGLGLGVGFAHAETPDALREAAAELGFPLFEVPYDVPFIALTEKAFSHLVNEQYAVLRRALSAHERLERIVLSEQGLEGVAAALASLIGGTALVYDARGAVLARSDGDVPLSPAALEAAGDELRERARGGARRGYAPAGDLHGRALALPVVRTPAGGNGDGPAPQAWLVAAKDRGGLTEFDRLVLHQAVTIVALELLRRRVADDTERRLAGDVLSAMVSGELAGPELARRLEPFGLRERVGVLVLTPPRSVKGLVEDGLTAALRDELHGGLAAGTGRFSCALLPLERGGSDEDLFALAERVRARASRHAGVELPGGRGPRRRRGRPAAHVPRGALRAGGAVALGRGERRRRAAAARHVPRPRLVPAAAVAAGRRGAAPVLRLDPRADRGRRGRVRRRADALARGVHRVQRAVGAGRAPALLPPSYAALPDPPRGGAHRPLAGLGARPDRLLARPARPRAGPMTPRHTKRGTTE